MVLPHPWLDSLSVHEELLDLLAYEASGIDLSVELRVKRRLGWYPGSWLSEVNEYYQAPLDSVRGSMLIII